MHLTARYLALTVAVAVALALCSAPALAAAAPSGGLNTTAISLFLCLVLITLGITYWAARKTKSANDFYAAGGKITGFQNGLAIAGDFMSAGAFLGLSGLVFASGFDGLVYAVGYTTGLPIVVFLLATRLRNLGRYTFTDVVSFRLGRTPVRIFSACASLVVVLLYLIAQMVGAGQLGSISAVAFATILAVVAGLTLAGASAVSHDLYASVFRRSGADDVREVAVSKAARLALGVIAVLLGIVFQMQNVAHMVSLAFAVACSSTFPVLLLSLYWRYGWPGCSGDSDRHWPDGMGQDSRQSFGTFQY